MWIGVLLVAAAALVGGRILAAADDVVEVWAAAGDLPAGGSISAGDLVSTSVHFDDADSMEAYVPIDADLVGRLLAQPVGAGQLISFSAIATGAPPIAELPVGVAAADLPSDLSAGDRIDVWAVPDDAQAAVPIRVASVLRDVRIISVTAPEIAAAGGERQVLIAVDTTSQVESALSALASSRPVLVRVGG
ncbi:MAG TPA: SAF domain-containing protein [Nocardioidaceae bacterium]|nr:SAF domain-containing protein [Nocardioidaceae bacterium]